MVPKDIPIFFSSLNTPGNLKIRQGPIIKPFQIIQRQKYYQDPYEEYFKTLLTVIKEDLNK